MGSYSLSGKAWKIFFDISMFFYEIDKANSLINLLAFLAIAYLVDLFNCNPNIFKCLLNLAVHLPEVGSTTGAIWIILLCTVTLFILLHDTLPDISSQHHALFVLNISKDSIILCLTYFPLMEINIVTLTILHMTTHQNKNINKSSTFTLLIVHSTHLPYPSSATGCFLICYADLGNKKQSFPCLLIWSNLRAFHHTPSTTHSQMMQEHSAETWTMLSTSTTQTNPTWITSSWITSFSTKSKA